MIPQELQDIVEHIDMAATFAKIGGFGRLIALVAPPNRPEKVLKTWKTLRRSPSPYTTLQE